MNLDFNASQHARPERVILPAGQYTVTAEKAFEKVSAAGATYLSVLFKLADGPYAGETVFDNFNLYHPKDTVRQWAQEQLAGFCQAIGKAGVAHSNELLGVPVTIEVGVQAPSGSYGSRNEVLGYFKYKTAGVTAPVQPPAGMVLPQASAAQPAGLAPFTPPGVDRGQTKVSPPDFHDDIPF